MFKWLDPWAKPQKLFETLYWWQRWLMPLAVVVLSVGVVWGLGFTPADYQQGDSYRIIHIHVPAAIWSMGAYAWMAIAAFIALVWQVKVAQWAIGAIAPIGAVFTAIALFTGAAWGKPMWGTWWVWDARLTSELILLFLYFGVMALQNAFADQQTGDKAASLLAVVGCGEPADHSLLGGMVEHPASRGHHHQIREAINGPQYVVAAVDLYCGLYAVFCRVNLFTAAYSNFAA
jgi:heme exporter protein C